MMRLQLATEDWIGARNQQQDSAFAAGIDDSKGAILILADGLGGHEGGAAASRIVVETFRDAAQKGAFNDPARRRSELRNALEAANQRIASGVDPSHGHRGMASTAVIAIVAEGTVSWISVGDSHLYVWRSGKLTKLNEDHSQAGLMVRSGQYKETDPEVLAAKSVLVSALTGRKLEIVDHPAEPFRLQTGDVLVLASDGLNTISEQEVAGIVTGGGNVLAEKLCSALIGAVKDRKADRQDNTTVAIARVIQAPGRPANEATTQVASSPPLRQAITTPSELQRAETHVPTPPKPRTPDPQHQRTVPSTPDNVVRSRPLAPGRPSAPKPVDADARTAALPAQSASPEVRTAIPPPPSFIPEAATKPAIALERRPAPVKAAPRGASVMPIFGLGMLALATIFGGLFVTEMAGVTNLFRREGPVVLAPNTNVEPVIKGPKDLRPSPQQKQPEAPKDIQAAPPQQPTPPPKQVRPVPPEAPKTETPKAESPKADAPKIAQPPAPPPQSILPPVTPPQAPPVVEPPIGTPPATPQQPPPSTRDGETGKNQPRSGPPGSPQQPVAPEAPPRGAPPAQPFAPEPPRDQRSGNLPEFTQPLPGSPPEDWLRTLPFEQLEIWQTLTAEQRRQVVARFRIPADQREEWRQFLVRLDQIDREKQKRGSLPERPGFAPLPSDRPPQRSDVLGCRPVQIGNRFREFPGIDQCFQFCRDNARNNFTFERCQTACLNACPRQ